ncbi:MAG: phosphoribosylamine--glycine ligase [Planctomycetes bacterium]|nr:phosphoribosylamine--glycine ligase [Planctomycetota bacterium]NUQ35360.1 phosphoribosylamine--glycine ligase [Planctomycetaceae bacterium]
MKVLVIGGGAREHALIWKLKQSPEVTKIFCAPGNPGIASLAECVDIPVKELAKLVRFALDSAIDLTVVGPEDPLVAGIVDLFQRNDLRIFGPTARAAQLEGSKTYSKELMLRHNIPTATARTFRDYDVAMQYLRTAQAPIVVKADGLAAGKGVSVCKTIEEAREVTRKMMRDEMHGKSGTTVVFEEFLEGEEISILAITDGHTIVPFEPAQDHKSIFDGNKGPNTGGMGTYSPLPQIEASILEEAERECVFQAIHAMNRDGVPFSGCLFAGLMITEDGPKVIEYNVRFGDPEAETMLRRLKSDLFPLLWHTTAGTLDQCSIEWDPRPVVTVILASGGYPGKPNPPTQIKGADADFGPDVVVFHAGTKLVDGKLMTAGGRVLAVSAIGDDLEAARVKAYAAADKIDFAGKQMRRDIGARGLTATRIE